MITATGGTALNSVSYYRPGTIKEALEILNEVEGVFPMAGGTDLAVQMRDGRKEPQGILDLSPLDMGGIQRRESGWSIGAGTTMTGLIEEAETGKRGSSLELVARAASVLGGQQIRNRATVGGNICNASPAADSVCALMAVDAEVTVENPGGKRRLDIADVFEGPGSTRLAKNELLTEIFIKDSNPPEGAILVQDYFKMGGRTSLVCAIASAACLTVMHENKVLSCSMAFGSVAPTPWKAKFPSEKLENMELTMELIRDSGLAAAGEISPIDDPRASGAYRRNVVRAFVMQHLLNCFSASHNNVKK